MVQATARHFYRARGHVYLTFRGLPAIRRWLEGLRDSWERGAAVVTGEIIDLGDDRVLSLGEWSGTGEASGVQTSIPLAGLDLEGRKDHSCSMVL